MWLTNKATRLFVGLSYVFERSFLYKHAANFVTVIGFICAGYAIFLLWINPEENKMLILLLSIGAAISDNLDGRIAKKLNISSQLGSDLDKARDKFFICSFFVWLIKETVRDIWINGIAGMTFILFIVGLCLLSEILLVIMWIRCRVKKIDASARRSGQIKMALYFIAAIWWFSGWALKSVIPSYYLNTVFVVLLLCAFIAAYYSLQTYYLRYDEDMKNLKKEKAS